MDTSIHFGRIRGIDIGANWTFLFIFALVTWTLAVAILPAVDEGLTPVAYWIVAAAIASLFFACLVAHEMGHAMVARRHGVDVHEITLWLLGGVSKLESDAMTARIEFRIAISGPIVSLALGLMWFGLAILATGFNLPGLVAGALVWLAFINAALGVFNILPAFPLDGGRVLRAALWWRGGNRLEATAKAARAGEFVAYGLIALGFLEVFSGAGIGGLWLVLIGWFVVSAGRAETEAVREHDLLEGLHVRDIMTKDPEVAPAALTAERFIDDYVISGRHTSYPVVDESGRTVGLMTVDRLRSIPIEQRPSTTLRQVAIGCEQLPSLSPDAPAADLIAPLVQGPATKVLVFDGDEVVGIVSAADLARVLHERASRASFLDTSARGTRDTSDQRGS